MYQKLANVLRFTILTVDLEKQGSGQAFNSKRWKNGKYRITKFLKFLREICKILKMVYFDPFTFKLVIPAPDSKRCVLWAIFIDDGNISHQNYLLEAEMIYNSTQKICHWTIWSLGFRCIESFDQVIDFGVEWSS